MKIAVGMRLAKQVLIVCAISHAGWAHGHARLSADGATPPRSTNSGIKTGPCGSDPRTTSAVFTPGQTVTIKWEETINHPGYFRIAFSPADDLGFDENVLLDNIIDEQNDSNTPHYYSADVTLPITPCDLCSIQLIQYMTESSPPSLYYSCADIKITTQTDDTPPAEAENLGAAPLDSSVELSWSNPAADFYKVMLLMNSSVIVDAPTAKLVYQAGDTIGSSQVVYVGSDTSATVNQLTNGELYYFKLITYDNSYNYSQGVDISVQLPLVPLNFAPTVGLTVMQAGKVTQNAAKNLGNVTVSAEVSDQNPGDQHSFTWSNSNSLLVDVDNIDSMYTFNSQNLPEESYTISVSVSDNGNPQQTTTKSVSIQIGEQPKDSGGSGAIGWGICITLFVAYLRRRLLFRHGILASSR